MSGLLCLQSGVSLKPSTTRDSNSLSAPHLCGPLSLEARVRNRCPVQAGVFSSHARNLYLIFKNKQTNKTFCKHFTKMLTNMSLLLCSQTVLNGGVPSRTLAVCSERPCCALELTFEGGLFLPWAKAGMRCFPLRVAWLPSVVSGVKWHLPSSPV